MRARAPGSAANLGPGFDAIALALNVYVEVEVLAAEAFSLESSGQGSEIPPDHAHLASRVVEQVLGHDRVHISVSSDIPLARGLGSSAALALAAAAAAGAEDPLGVAVNFEGHAENASASFLGGLVVASSIDGRPMARRLVLDPALRFVVVVPERTIETGPARTVLPDTVARSDAVHNLGRLGLLIAGMADAPSLVPAACDDRLHQPYRASLFPQADDLMRALKDGGAVTACWSGSGSALLGMCVGDAAAESARRGASAVMSDLGLVGEVFAVEPDLKGLVVEE